VLSRRDQMEHLAWVVPLIAVAATGVFLATGLANSKSVPPTIAALEIHRVLPGTNETRTEGLAAIYDSQSRSTDWAVDRRRWAIPVPPSTGEIRRLVWLDDDAVVPDNASTAAGSVGTARLTAATVSNGPLAVTAEFGPDGLEGFFGDGGAGSAVPSDGVIVQASMPGLPVTALPDGRFTADADDVLAAGEYAAGGLLSDEQARRHAVLQQLLIPDDGWVFPREPSLLAWSDDLAWAGDFPEGYDTVGAALNVVPLTLRRTPPGTRFTVPSTFLKPTIEAGRSGTSTAYSGRTGQWVKGLTRGGETVLRFELPAEVRPCQLDGGTLSIRCTIPSRQLKIVSYSTASSATSSSATAEPTEVFSRANPSGVLTIPLSAEHLALDAGGGVRLGIAVGNLEQTETSRDRSESEDESGLADFQDTGWQIDYARLTLTGETSAAREEP